MRFVNIMGWLLEISAEFFPLYSTLNEQFSFCCCSKTQASLSHTLSMIPEMLMVCSKEGLVAGSGYFSSVLSYFVFIEKTCIPNAVEICRHIGMASHRSFGFGDVCAKIEMENTKIVKKKIRIKEKYIKKRSLKRATLNLLLVVLKRMVIGILWRQKLL